MGKGYLLVVALVVLTSACESDEAKYKRLDQDLAIARLEAAIQAKAAPYDRIICSGDSAHVSTDVYLACVRKVEVELEDAKSKLALAERKMNRFMGR